MSKQIKTTIALAVALILTLIVSSFSSFALECNEIRNNVFRLHIIANSNSDVDQELKLKVRDAILEQTADTLCSTDADTAKQLAKDNIENIEKIAKKVIIENGYEYDVKAEVVNMFFDIRHYDDITMPAGRYDALRITIGDAVGKNWWCVLYPPICLPCAQPKQELSDVLTDAQTDIVENEPKYAIRFKLVEIFEQIKDSLFG